MNYQPQPYSDPDPGLHPDLKAIPSSNPMAQPLALTVAQPSVGTQ